MSGSEHAAEAPGHEPPPLPDSVRRDDIQALDDGAGDLFHRRNRVRRVGGTGRRRVLSGGARA